MKKINFPAVQPIDWNKLGKNPAVLVAGAGAVIFASSYLVPYDSPKHDKIRIAGAMITGAGIGAFATQAVQGNLSAEKFALIDKQNETLRTVAQVTNNLAKIAGITHTEQTVTKTA